MVPAAGVFAARAMLQLGMSECGCLRAGGQAPGKLGEAHNRTMR